MGIGTFNFTLKCQKKKKKIQNQISSSEGNHRNKKERKESRERGEPFKEIGERTLVHNER